MQPEVAIWEVAIRDQSSAGTSANGLILTPMSRPRGYAGRGSDWGAA